MILMIILIKGALDRRLLESHQDLPLLHDQDRWICWGWGKYENIREKFFSSNWVERKSKNITEDGIFLHKSFFFRFGTSYTTRGSQSLQSRYMGNDVDKVPVIRQTWLLFAPLLKRSLLWIQRFSSRLPIILSTAWKWTRQELWYALVLQTGSIYYSGSLSPYSSPGFPLFPRSASLIQLDNSLASCSKLDRTNANDMFDGQCRQTSDLPISAWLLKSFDLLITESEQL